MLPGAVLWTRGTAATVPEGTGNGTGTRTGTGYPVLPDGCMDLLWSDTGGLCVAGPDTVAHQGGEGDGVRWAGVRFFPGTAPAILGVPANEIRDRRVPLADLWPAARVRRLTGRMEAAHDMGAALEALAMDSADGAPPPDPLALAVVAALGTGHSVAATARETGVGLRLLHRRSVAAFGYGPKTLGRILRLQRALALVIKGTPYASAAHEAGYADQAHLARDVRDLTGMPLGELLRRRAEPEPEPGQGPTAPVRGTR
ncbi:AraC family transcriptional regulator [Streptomyces tsukubensis]|uniref:AraC family transcriptional regulator n=1 Tax=Streptomyces tsukubensis TaxID=83656 RepID=A0A1V4AAB0_9ACTN|nr:AraC family transcriptional regulator [Streptomyces tsukubensis]